LVQHWQGPTVQLKGRVHLRHDLRYDLRFDLRFGACVTMTRQGNAFPCVIMHDACTESQVKSKGITQVDTDPKKFRVRAWVGLQQKHRNFTQPVKVRSLYLFHADDVTVELEAPSDVAHDDRDVVHVAPELADAATGGCRIPIVFLTT
jgi:hypothetical protein